MTVDSPHEDILLILMKDFIDYVLKDREDIEIEEDDEDEDC